MHGGLKCNNSGQNLFGLLVRGVGTNWKFSLHKGEDLDIVIVWVAKIVRYLDQVFKTAPFH